MSNETILRKVIQKAHANGYKPRMRVEQIIAHNNQYQNPIAIIFTQDFAKAFWGEEDWTRVAYTLFANPPQSRGNILTEPKLLKPWQYHLQQMVLEENPLEYLTQFLDYN
jgi:hypothetical protein